MMESERVGKGYARYLTKKTNFDEKHYESVREFLNTKVSIDDKSFDAEISKDEVKLKSNKFSEKNEYLKSIRKRGEVARQK